MQKKSAVPLRVLLRCVVFFLFAILSQCGCGIAWAEDGYAVFDYSDSLSEYAQRVALLNTKCGTVSELEEKGISDGATMFAVLCKTDGSRLDAMEDGLIYVIVGPDNRYTLYYDSLDCATAAVSRYVKQKGMVYAELDSEVKSASAAQVERADYSFHSWGATQMNYGVYLNHVGRWGRGSATVAVIDSGVFRHPMLEGRLTESGYDYVDADNDSTNDLFGHGTHVAGIIADCSCDTPVYICPIRVLNAGGGGKTSNVVNAILEAIERGVDVINLSIETRVMSDAMDSAIEEALSGDITVVVAAGNSACDTEEICPAHLKNRGVIVVGAAELDGGECVRAEYSNYGDSVDLYAFGSAISSCSRTGDYVEDTGTSMAAPHISAMCAMLKLLHPGLSPDAVEERAVAAAGVGTGVFVPDLLSMIPQAEGFHLHELKLCYAEEIPLPAAAWPLSSREAVRYSSDDHSVVAIESGKVVARGIGTAHVTASCVGFEDTSFEVTVCQAAGFAPFSLPASLRTLEDEACLGDASIERVILPDGLERVGAHAFEDCAGLRTIVVPPSVEQIGENSFSGAVVFCAFGSAAMRYCEERDLQYIINCD